METAAHYNADIPRDLVHGVMQVWVQTGAAVGFCDLGLRRLEAMFVGFRALWEQQFKVFAWPSVYSLISTQCGLGLGFWV